MKNYRFPYFASRVESLIGGLNGVRALFVFGLVAALSCLPFYALAQNDTPQVKEKPFASYEPSSQTPTYIITRDKDGKTECRQATIDEARTYNVPKNEQLRQINHLDRDFATMSPAQAPVGLTIVLRATAQLDANPTAKQAFIDAAAKWESLIKDQITVAVDVDYGTTFFGMAFSSPNVLGATSSPQFSVGGNYPDVRQRLINRAPAGSTELALDMALPATSVPTDIGASTRVYMGSPILRALGLLSPSYVNDPQGIPAPQIAFNSAFGFDFNPNDGITGNRTDFDAVAVHEMGHLLGFDSFVGDRELDPTDPLGLTVWDLFRFRPGTANLNNFGTAQRILSSGPVGGSQVQFSGGPELGLSTGRPDGTGGDEEQAAHWRADEQSGTFIGIMDPTIARNVRETMTANDQNTVDFFGYQTQATSAPPNDNFVNAQLIVGSSGAVSGTNTFATRETGEPTNPAGTGGGRSVWYSWTAPGTGQATFDTIGSNYDSLLAAYVGNAVNGLTVLASNDDIDPPGAPQPRNIQSRIVFNVTAGTTYRIQVDGFDADQGNIVLNWTAPGTPTPTPTPTPGPNTVQFTTATAAASEAPNTTTKIDLTVSRTGNLIREASVDYATSDATATERSDYETARGTLSFAAGEGSKTVTLFIINDAFGETAEVFNVTLNNPVNSALGSPPAVQVTINSDESVTGNNPVKNATFDSDFFVRQHYLDFLSREPDTGGLNFWKGQLQECENVPLPGGFTDAQQCRDIRRINVSAAFFLAIEFQQTGYLVERLYKSAYGDAIGTSTFGGTHTLAVPVVRYNEFVGDSQQIGRGVVIGQPGADQLLEANKQALINQFVLRTRFTTAYPTSLTPTQFVDTLNTNAGNVLSTAERNVLIADLTSGARTRAQVLRAVAEDSDLVNNEKNKAFVLSQFIGYLRRNPNDAPENGLDYTGYDFWLQKLNEFNGNFVNAEMVKAFIVSGEYQQRFGQ